MQKTQQTVSVETVMNAIWHSMNDMRGCLPYSNIAVSVLTFLYAYHKGYDLLPVDGSNYRFNHEDDELMRDLMHQCRMDALFNRCFCGFQRYMSDIDKTAFNSVYVSVLHELFEQISLSSGQREGDFFSPIAITKLMAYFVNKDGCTSVYDPFCGTASIAHEVSKDGSPINFVGQEINITTSLFSRINVEALYGTDKSIIVGDSVTQWNKSHFDAIVSCPPLGVRFSQNKLDMLSTENTDFQCKTMDDIALTRPFNINGSKLTVTLHPVSFCFKGSHDRELRRYLIERNHVDTIVYLPAGMLYGTSIACIVLVCKSNRGYEDPIRFIFAEKFVQGDRRNKTIDVEGLISVLDGDNPDCIYASRQEIIDYDYNFTPDLYVKRTLKEGQQFVKLGSILEQVRGERIDMADIDQAAMNKQLSNNIIDVLLRKNSLCSVKENRRNASGRLIHVNGNKLLLVFSMLGEKRYGLYTDDKDFVCSADIRVYKIDESIVTPEYLVYSLINDGAINKGTMMLSDLLSFPIVVDKKKVQDEIINELVQQYDKQTRQERDADAQRLGVKQHISDLEHMLGTTQVRIGKIISRLERNMSDADRLPDIVKSLKDNIGYMNRIIHYTNARIESEIFNKRPYDIVRFVKDYVDSWKNYGGAYFDLQIAYEIEERCIINCDTSLLTVMFDSILNNAVRHSFLKNKNYTDHNVVQIGLSLVCYKDRPYVSLTFANNGNPFAEGFTLNDYISRGRYSAATGRSGLGGYHVYQIAKGHDGYIYLDSNKTWNVVVEVLLPTDSTETKYLSSYEHECI